MRTGIGEMANAPTLLDAALVLAAQAHAGQRRKYTNTPYLSHCIEVVNILIEHGIDDQVMLAAAALHDVLEDTDFPLIKFFRRRYKADWTVEEGNRLVGLAFELTEPTREGNRATRKALEAQRLSQISPEAQTIKYADLISNTSSIVQHDEGFAKVYLQEKWNILGVMRQGHEGLLNAALVECSQAADDICLELA